MVAIRLIVFAVALIFSVQSEAQQVSAYEAVGIGGANNAVDVNAQNNCTLADGCVSAFSGLSSGLCKNDPTKICFMESIPAGACSAGTNSACIYPSGWNSSAQLTDPNCFCTGKLALDGVAGPIPTPSDPNGDLSVEIQHFESTSCGGVQGRCSDGDPGLFIGGFGVSLGTRINPTSTTNVGFESNGAPGVDGGLGLTAPRFGMENPPLVITPQRYPGTGVDDPSATGTAIVDVFGGPAAGSATAFVPVTGNLDPNVFTDATTRQHWTDLRDQFGIRTYVGKSDSVWSEWAFNSGQISGSGVNSLIVTHPCDVQRGWSVDDPVIGTCENNPATACNDNFPEAAATDACGMLTDPNCTANGGIGDAANMLACGRNCVGTSYCWEQAGTRESVSFLYTRDIAAGELQDGNNSLVGSGGDLTGKCPPDCGVDYTWNTLEQEAVDNLLATPDKPDALQLPDPNYPVIIDVGYQAMFDHFSGARAGEGDVVSLILVFSNTWINKGDLRCFVGGDRAILNATAGGSPAQDPNNYLRTGRCATGNTGAAGVPCVPFGEDSTAIAPLNGGTFDDCSPGGAADTLECLGCGTSPPHLVPVANGGTFVAGAAANVVVPANANDPARGWIPPGFNDYNEVNDGCGGPGGTCAAYINLIETPGRANDNGVIGGLINRGYDVKVPLLVAGTTGFAGGVARDNTTGGFDDAILGGATGGSTGLNVLDPDYDLGTRLAFNGKFPTAAFVMPASQPGTTVLNSDPNFGSLAYNANFGPGADGIPGCFGDNNNALGDGPCNDPLGDVSASSNPNTGVDDVATQTRFTRPSLSPTENCEDYAGGVAGGASCAGFTLQQDLRPRVPNPLDAFPTIVYVGAGAGRDVPVVLNANTDFVFKFDTASCPATAPNQANCVGLGDPDRDRLGSAFDGCPSAFDPSQTASSSSGPGGVIGAACLCGDADETGAVNIVDAQGAGKVAVGILPPNSFPLALADVDRSGGVNIVDAQAMGKIAVGAQQLCDTNCAAGPKTTDSDFSFERAGCIAP